MSPDGVDATQICVEECGAACCHSGAFVRPADKTTLREAGYGHAVDASTVTTRTDAGGDCMLLDASGRCEAYEDRPLDCRLFPLGFILDDESRTVQIVLVGCPLSEHYSEAARAQLIERAEILLAEFSAESLRRYDSQPFTSEPEPLTTIPYDTLPHDL